MAMALRTACMYTNMTAFNLVLKSTALLDSFESLSIGPIIMEQPSGGLWRPSSNSHLLVNFECIPIQPKNLDLLGYLTYLHLTMLNMLCLWQSNEVSLTLNFKKLITLRQILLMGCSIAFCVTFKGRTGFFQSQFTLSAIVILEGENKRGLT